MILAGQFTGEATFGTLKLNNPGATPKFFPLASIAADGSAWRWARTASSGANHTATALAVDAMGPCLSPAHSRGPSAWTPPP